MDMAETDYKVKVVSECFGVCGVEGTQPDWLSVVMHHREVQHRLVV